MPRRRFTDAQVLNVEPAPVEEQSARTETINLADVQIPSTNGTGQHDLEELPDFTLPPDGVRPSERCGTPSPLGFSCEFRDEHTGRHSWQPAEVADDPKAAPGQGPRGAEVQDTGTDVEQGELPGTPVAEAEPTDYDVPFEAQFNGKDLVDAPGLRAIGERLIETATERDAFDHLRGIQIHWFWKRRGGTQGGNPRYGGIKRPSSFEKHYAGGRVIYFAWLAADHVREAKFTPEQIEACLYSQLCRTDVDPDDHDAYRTVGPDFVGFVREIERYGVWSADLREAAARIQQLPLVQVAADDDSDDADGETEEGEGGE